MALIDGREAGLFWQSRMGNNADGIGGNCHRYDVVADQDGSLRHTHFLVDYGVKLGGGHGYSCQFPSPVGLLARRGADAVEGGGAPPEALFLTHAHQDHIGALPHLLSMGYQLPPIYCTPFTAQMVTRSFATAGIPRTDWPAVTVLTGGQQAQIGGAAVQVVPVDHLPDAAALLIRTADAAVFHTGDYKFDDTLPFGGADPAQLRRIGQAGVDLVVSDSTAAAERQPKVTERQICDSLTRLVADNRGRAVVAGILGTQLDRLVSLGRAATANERALVITGRSLVDNVAAMQRAGIDIEKAIGAPLLLAQQAQDLSADKALVVTTGAFAQPMAGLTRAAEQLPGALAIGPDTTVIIPQRAIPPVAGPYKAMVGQLERLGARVVTPDRAEAQGYGSLHQSGHAIESDTKLLYTLLKPRQLVAPIHGGPKQLEANARLARSLGIEALALAENGAVVAVQRQGARVLGGEALERIGAADSGRRQTGRPRARPGEGRLPPAPPIYRYDRLDADGRLIARDIRGDRPGGRIAAGDRLRQAAGDGTLARLASRLPWRRDSSR